ncbi:hypothetical protein TSUD_326710 [Trifolium subterraneum]|uniref:Uncharacterized protein n=1 Tax=Trifolium subterraneum TaxID=3900 RepID=A0A2Z6LZ97_TRISU|nr:hypothetical protein TSUD_326710 [Trifolium subterraneum]
MVILRELSDDSGSSLISPASTHRVHGIFPKLWFRSSSEESDSDSSTSSDCVIISPSSFTGKELVEYQPVVLDASTVRMDSTSKYNSAEMIRCFREIVKLYSRENEEEVVVDPVGEDGLVTTVNTVEPHYFYIRENEEEVVVDPVGEDGLVTTFEGDVLRALNVAPIQLHPNTWGFIKAFEGRLLSLSSQANRGLFTLYASNFKNYKDTFLRLRCGPNLPDLMYDNGGERLFPFYWSDNPTLVKGVREDMLTPFEKEIVDFLDSFLILDIKDVLRRESDVKSIRSFLKRMKRVPDEEWLAYLAKSKQKKLALDAHVDPSLQLIIDADSSKGVKRKKKTEGSKVITKIPRKEGDSSSAVSDLIPPSHGLNRHTRSSTATVVEVAADGDATKEGGATGKGDAVSTDGTKSLGSGPTPEVVQPVAATAGPSPSGADPSAWGSEFDPAAFISDHLTMKGDSSMFDALGIAEFRKLCIGQGLKSVVVSHFMFVRQEKEAQEAGDKVAELEKTVATLQSRYDEEKARMKKEVDALKKAKEDDANKLKKDKEDSLAELKTKHDGVVESLKKKQAEDIASLRGVNMDLVRSRNDYIVALCQSTCDAVLVSEDLKDLEDENSALREEMADKYVEGFAFAVEQMKVVFPNVNPTLLAELDFMKKIEGGRLVPR